MRFAFLTSILAGALMIGCGDKPGPPAVKATKDPKLVAIEQQIAKTTPEGKLIIEKVKKMKPEVNDQPADKTLEEIIKDYAENKGTFNISPIGWEAAQKKNGRWKIGFHYQDYQKQYQFAEWEYNPETNKLYPFEFTNAPQFWSGAPAKGKAKK
jgi:hypothetical protein